jgi:hypothetical protein
VKKSTVLLASLVGIPVIIGMLVVHAHIRSLLSYDWPPSVCVLFFVCLAPIGLGIGLSVLPAFVRGVCVAHIQCTGHSCMHVAVSSLGYKGLSENSWPKATACIMEVGWYSASPCVLSFGRAYDTLFCFLFFFLLKWLFCCLVCLFDVCVLQVRKRMTPSTGRTTMSSMRTRST